MPRCGLRLRLWWHIGQLLKVRLRLLWQRQLLHVWWRMLRCWELLQLWWGVLRRWDLLQLWWGMLWCGRLRWWSR